MPTIIPHLARRVGREPPDMDKPTESAHDATEYLHGFAVSLRSRGKLPSTVESYVRDAQRFVSYTMKYKLQLKDAEPETMLAFQEFLRHELGEKENSVRRTVIGVRQFYRYLTSEQQLGGTPFDIVPIPHRDERLPKALKPEQIDLLVRAAAQAAPAIKGARDVAMVLLLVYEGLKANELIELRWVDLLDDGSTMSLSVSGSRARAITLSAPCRESLLRYKDLHAQITHKAITQAPDKRVLVAFKGRVGLSPLPTMTRHGLKFVLYELGEKTQIPHLNTELLRHYAVTHLIGLGRSPEEIMHHLGLRRLGNIAKHLHSSKSTTSDETPRSHTGSASS